MEVSLRDMGLDASMMAAIQDMLDLVDEPEKPYHPSRAYIQDNKAMRTTPADIIEYPNYYQFIVDMPGLKHDQMKVLLEDGNVLGVSGERRRDKKEDENVKYVRMERKLGKLLKKFVLPENANLEKISANYQDGVSAAGAEEAEGD